MFDFFPNMFTFLPNMLTFLPNMFLFLPNMVKSSQLFLNSSQIWLNFPQKLVYNSPKHVYVLKKYLVIDCILKWYLILKYSDMPNNIMHRWIRCDETAYLNINLPEGLAGGGIQTALEIMHQYSRPGYNPWPLVFHY